MNTPVQMIKVVDFETKELILEGVNTLANAVSSTLGPAGRTVMIEVLNANPVLTKDGVSVAEVIHLEDPVSINSFSTCYIKCVYAQLRR